MAAAGGEELQRKTGSGVMERERERGMKGGREESEAATHSLSP